MMTKKKRKILIISILLVTLLIIATLLIVLYLNTDMFKSNQTLFFKYFGKNLENVKEIEKILENTEYEKSLENRKYTEDIQIKANYTEDYGTTLESTSNSINNLKLTIEEQTDNANKYNYKDIKLLKDDEQMLQLEYAQSNDIYGIKFSDLFKQYLLVENSNLKELFEKMGYSGEIEGLQDISKINKDGIVNSIKFTDEEIQELKEKYINVINQNISKENFTKESNKKISINEKEIEVNAYILNLTKEQLNNIYINILQNIKNEEIILKKIDNIQDTLNKSIISSTEDVSIRERIIQEIDGKIEKISRNNIGTEKTKIIVYENQGKTIRTTIQGVDYQINFDYIKTEQENLMQFKLEENEKETLNISINKNDKKVKLNIENKENNNPIVISVEKDNHTENKKNINIKYEDEINRLEINAIINTVIVDEFENPITFNNENNINLNELNEQELNAILDRVSQEIQKKIEVVNQEINIEDLKQILVDIGIVNDIQILEGEGISETEKNRFNSKFEIIEGDNIKSEELLKLFEVIEDNIIDLQAVSNKELKIEISKENKNEDLAKVLKEFIEKDKNRNYNAKVEYDSETGLVKYVILTILEKR